MLSDKCKICVVENCVECSAYDVCLTCDEARNYFQVNGKCEIYSITGCIDCLDQEKC